MADYWLLSASTLAQALLSLARFSLRQPSTTMSPSFILARQNRDTSRAQADCWVLSCADAADAKSSSGIINTISVMATIRSTVQSADNARACVSLLHFGLRNGGENSQRRDADHQIVAVDHLGAAGDPQDSHCIRRGVALDPLGILGVMGDEAAADLVSIRSANQDRIAA